MAEEKPTPEPKAATQSQDEIPAWAQGLVQQIEKLNQAVAETQKAKGDGLPNYDDDAARNDLVAAMQKKMAELETQMKAVTSAPLEQRRATVANRLGVKVDTLAGISADGLDAIEKKLVAPSSPGATDASLGRVPGGGSGDLSEADLVKGIADGSIPANDKRVLDWAKKVHLAVPYTIRAS